MNEYSSNGQSNANTAASKRRPLRSVPRIVSQPESNSNSSKATTPALSEDIEGQSNGSGGSGDTEMLIDITSRHIGTSGTLAKGFTPLGGSLGES